MGVENVKDGLSELDRQVDELEAQIQAWQSVSDNARRLCSGWAAIKVRMKCASVAVTARPR